MINIGIEGVFLSTACIAAVASYLGWGLWPSFLAAMVGGVMIMSLVALIVLVFKADQIVTGFGLNLVALGVTTVVVKSLPALNSVEDCRSSGRSGGRASSPTSSPRSGASSRWSRSSSSAPRCSTARPGACG